MHCWTLKKQILFPNHGQSQKLIIFEIKLDRIAPWHFYTFSLSEIFFYRWSKLPAHWKAFFNGNLPHSLQMGLRILSIFGRLNGFRVASKDTVPFCFFSALSASIKNQSHFYKWSAIACGIEHSGFKCTFDPSYFSLNSVGKFSLVKVRPFRAV